MARSREIFSCSYFVFTYLQKSQSVKTPQTRTPALSVNAPLVYDSIMSSWLLVCSKCQTNLQLSCFSNDLLKKTYRILL